MSAFYDWIQFGLPPGPRLIPMRYYLNLHKGSLPLVILSLMSYFNNFSLPCWVYLALHGSYGLIWIIKDYTFPDSSFQTKSTIPCVFVGFFGVLCPYLWGAYLLACGEAPQVISRERVCLVTMVFCIGLILMMGSDGQKYFTLRLKKGLIKDGFAKYSRNPNYLGEIMIYTSFAMTV